MAASDVRVSDDVDVARSREYALLAWLLRSPPDQEFLKRLGALDTDRSALGSAHAELAAAARRLPAAQVANEYFELFIGVGRGELLPYASFYLTGSLYGRPLSELRQWLAERGFERDTGTKEPEDHAAFLCELSATLTQDPTTVEESNRFFRIFLAPWIGRFFADLEKCKSADFYASVARVGRVFVDIEIESLKRPVALA